MADYQSLFPFYTPPPDVQPVLMDGSLVGNDGLDFSRILFLDFDGVLHPEVYTDQTQFCYLQNFRDALDMADPEHKVPIVISSTWRYHHTLESIRSKLLPSIADRVISVTPNLTRNEIADIKDWDSIGGEESKLRHRQREVLQWINACAPGARWLAIDDRPEYFHKACEHLFLVPKSEGGLTSKVSVALLLRLGEFLSSA